MTPDELIQVITLLTKGFGVETACQNQQDWTNKNPKTKYKKP